MKTLIVAIALVPSIVFASPISKPSFEKKMVAGECSVYAYASETEVDNWSVVMKHFRNSDRDVSFARGIGQGRIEATVKFIKGDARKVAANLYKDADCDLALEVLMDQQNNS